MSKSERASPGGSTARRTRETRRSPLVKVPSFSPQMAAGSTTWASSVVGVVNPSWTTRRSSLERAHSSRARLGNDTGGLVATTHRALMVPSQIPSMMSG